MASSLAGNCVAFYAGMQCLMKIHARQLETGELQRQPGRQEQAKPEAQARNKNPKGRDNHHELNDEIFCQMQRRGIKPQRTRQPEVSLELFLLPLPVLVRRVDVKRGRLPSVAAWQLLG